MKLREIEAVHALNTMSQVSETKLDIEAIMHELSVDSEVTFCKVMGSAESCQLDQVSIRLRIPGPWIRTGHGPHLHLQTGVAYSELL